MTDLALSRARAELLDDDAKLRYVGIYLLKKLDLEPKDGGLEIPVVLPPELSPLDEALQHLAVEDLLVIDHKKARWQITKQGLAYLGTLIDEASDLVDEFEEDETEDVVAELRRRNLDPLRARFLWGWYDGELDDLVAFQEQRGARPIERMWAFYLTGDALWVELARDLDGDGVGDDGDRNDDDDD